MITTRPEVELAGLYTQKQAAEALRVERHTIKRYEANNLIRFRVRKAGSHKVTTGADIIKCWQSMYL